MFSSYNVTFRYFSGMTFGTDKLIGVLFEGEDHLYHCQLSSIINNFLCMVSFISCLIKLITSHVHLIVKSGLIMFMAKVNHSRHAKWLLHVKYCY